MRILVAGGFEADSLFAHAINTVKMAQGFARLRHDVTLVCRRPKSGPVDPDELAARFGLSVPLTWRQLPHFVGEGRKFAACAMIHAKRFRPDLVYARNYVLPAWSSRLGLETVGESHAHPDNHARKFCRFIRATTHRRFKRLVTISHHLADHYRARGVPAQKLLVLPDAVDLESFRRPANLPPGPFPTDKPNIVYAGHLYDYKGIPTVLEAAAQMPEARFHFVGGCPEDVVRQRKRAEHWALSNTVFHGLRPQAEVPPYLWHADALLLPPSRHHPSARWTSPVKLGEYLASGTPVVATDIPALRDWLTDDAVEFARADDPGDLARAVRCVLRDRARAHRLRQTARRLAERLSYTRRAQTILHASMTID